MQDNQVESNKKPLSETKKGLAIAFLGGFLGGPLGLVASPTVLLLLRKYWNSSGSKVPNRFLAWSLIGLVGAPFSLLVLAIPLAKISNDKAISNCNTGELESCRELLDSSSGIKKQITNPNFKNLLDEEAKKKDEALNIKLKADAEEAKRKEEALKIKLKADAEAIEINQLLKIEKERKRKWKEFKEWGESPNPWISCEAQLKSLLLDPDSYRNNFGWASTGPKRLLQADGYVVILRWRFRSKNTLGGYSAAYARCENSYDWDRDGFGKPVVTIKN